MRTALCASLVLAITSLVAPVGAADQRVAWIGPRPIVLPVPPGYCPADRTDAAQGFIATQLEDMVRPHVLMLAFDIDCRVLAAFKAKGGGPVTPYVLFHAVRDGDRIASYQGTRAAFVAEASHQVDAPAFQAELNAMAKDVDSALQQRFDALAAEIGGSVTVLGTQLQEPLGHDENAVYVGYVSQFDTPNGPAYTAGVTGSTLIGGVVVTVNLYRDYQDSETFVTSLREVRALVAMLVAANGN